MFSANKEQSSLKERSRLLYAQVDSLKESLYADLLERFRQDKTIGEQEAKWKLGIMVASISTALFSRALAGNKEYPVIYAYFKIKLSEHSSGGESAIEECIGLIADFMNRTDYDPIAFTDTIALWLYFHIRGKEQLMIDETTPYLLVAQFINNNFFNWFDEAK
ncbi:hypothetical protein [Paenibacillus arenilitoris]|uniref:Uncharacterized protein n=1 Tax=Paenibacillus arenilitoris TaxID=2772299 RepID=A0A927CL51_9BACL|nr:hypothetical protein [Paenibacillus arenilitoris]MBD2870088.1 hypothetical protein [Paenibacillus arenilitoris]